MGATTTSKPFWRSKTVALNALLTLIGVSLYFADPTHAPAATLASIAAAAAGVGTIVLRVWFTTKPIAARPS